MSTSALVPRDKYDIERVEALVAAGPEAAISILPELLEWIQDMNWPVALPLSEYLVTIGEPLIPHLRKILTSDDHWWIYSVLLHIVEDLPVELVRSLKPELDQLVGRSENDFVALRIGAVAGVWDNPTTHRLLANSIAAHQEFLDELKQIQSKLPPLEH
jgi:hypothetical protein